MSTLNRRASEQELLLRETHHRCSNDLQLIIGLLTMQSRRASNAEARQVLSDAVDRVSILARARRALDQNSPASLDEALLRVCEALQSHAEPRSILISLTTEASPRGLSSQQIVTAALAVNELATNAIKHAFEEGKGGHVQITAREQSQQVVILVDDDGLPFPELETRSSKDGGLGLGIVRRLVASAGGLVIAPTSGRKVFELRLPINAS